MNEIQLKLLIEAMAPAMDSALDPMCIVGPTNKILHLTASMKAFLSIRPRDLSKGPVLCDLLKLSVCESGCKIVHAIKAGQTLRLDETPAVRGDMKLRVVVKAVPLFDPAGKIPEAIGAIVSIRDTTGEIIVQAKYHKLMQIIEEKDSQISDLNKRIDSLRKTLKEAAISKTAK